MIYPNLNINNSERTTLPYFIYSSIVFCIMFGLFIYLTFILSKENSNPYSYSQESPSSPTPKRNNVMMDNKEESIFINHSYLNKFLKKLLK